MPNVLSPRDLVSKPDNMDKTVLHHTHTPNMQQFANLLLLHVNKTIFKRKCCKICCCCFLIFAQNIDCGYFDAFFDTQCTISLCVLNVNYMYNVHVYTY